MITYYIYIYNNNNKFTRATRAHCALYTHPGFVLTCIAG